MEVIAIVSEKRSFMSGAKYPDNLNAHQTPTMRAKMPVICATNPLNPPHTAVASTIINITMSMIFKTITG